jgi:hypothetical protein
MNTSGGGVSRARLIKCGRALVVCGSLGMAASAGGCAGTVRTPAVEAAPAGASSSWAMPTGTMRWNEYACELIARNQIGQQRSARVLAYLNLAINNAVRVATQQGRKSDGAAAGSAATVLVYAFPTNASAIEARLAGETAALGTGATRDDFASAVQVGQTAGGEVVAVAKTDRFDLAWTGTVPTGPGKWVSSSQPAIFPRLGEMRPFFLTSSAEFRPSPPPALDSSEFKAALAEVRSISDHRTTEQLRIAQFWDQTSGSYSAGVWNDVARKAIAAHGLGDAEAARVLALAHMAAVDAFIACHDGKYTYWLARPTQVDPDIRLAIGLPNHPSYPGNHGCVSTAFGTVLDAAFPDQNGRYATMARQAAESRIYAGIHYRFDNDAGMDIGRKVAARALATGLPAYKAYLPAQR